MMRIRNYFIAFASVFAILSACALVGVRDVKAQEDVALDSLIKRIEALESRPSTSNVTAGKINKLKIGFDMRHRFEIRDQMPNANNASFGYFANAGTRNGRNVIWGVGDAATAGDQSGPGRAETSEFMLQRVRLNLDADINRNVRAFIQLQDVRTFGEEGLGLGGAPSGTIGNLNRTDLQQGYVELRNLGDLNSIFNNLELRVGRWGQNYGNQRLIGTLGWANQGRSYDGGRLRWDNKKHWVDLFAFQIEEKETGGASGGIAPGGSGIDEVLYGAYTHFNVLKGVVAEPYFIARTRTAEGDRLGVAGNTSENRYTFGFRLAGKNLDVLPGADFTIEPAWQMGEATGLRAGDFVPVAFGAGDVGNDIEQSIQAFAIHAEAGYTFKSLPWTPRIGYAYSFASGDDSPNTGSTKTFDHLYPTGHAHNGYMDMTGWQNIRDHQIHLSASPTKKLALDCKVHFMRLDQVEDNWYSVGGGTGFGGGIGIIRPGANTYQTVNDVFTGTFQDVDPDLGQEVDFTVKYKLFNNFGVTAGYSHFFAGDFIEDTGSGIDRGVDWAYIQTSVKF